MKFWDVDLTPHVRWFQWGCWLSLALYGAGGAWWWDLSWSDWAERMVYALLLPATALLALGYLTCPRGGILAALATGLLALLLVHEPARPDLTDARQTGVMLWVLTTALAVHHDARGKSNRLKWVCWLALALLYVAARFWERLPWQAWSGHLLAVATVPALVILVSTVVYRDFRRTLAVVGMAGFYWRLLTVGNTLDPDSLRKSAVVLWLLTVALAVANDVARVSAKVPSEEASAPA